jgi:hypothetical protein
VASKAAAIAMMKAVAMMEDVLQAMNHSFEKAGLHSNKSDSCNVTLSSVYNLGFICSSG